MLIECFFGDKNIFEFSGHTSANFAIEMWLFEMLGSLFIIIEVDVFELLWVFVANETLLMRMFKMSSELINIVEGVFAEGASRMEKYKIPIFTELPNFDMSMIFSFCVENLFRMYTLSIVETNITILPFVFEIKMPFQLIQTIKYLFTLIKGTVITGFVLDLFSHFLVWIIIVRVFL